MIVCKVATYIQKLRYICVYIQRRSWSQESYCGVDCYYVYPDVLEIWYKNKAMSKKLKAFISPPSRVRREGEMSAA